MNLKLSKIKDKQAAIEDIDYSIKRKIDISVIKDLANMNFIRNHQNIIITGKTGTGKSYISQALGNRAARFSYSNSLIRSSFPLKKDREIAGGFAFWFLVFVHKS